MNFPSLLYRTVRKDSSPRTANITLQSERLAQWTEKERIHRERVILVHFASSDKYCTVLCSLLQTSAAENSIAGFTAQQTTGVVIASVVQCFFRKAAVLPYHFFENQTNDEDGRRHGFASLEAEK